MIRLATTPTKWLIAIVVLGAILRFFPIWFGLPYMAARPDEEVAVSIATRMQHGDLNPGFFHWPSLTFYVFSGLYTVVSTIRDLLSLDPSLSVPDRALIGRAFVALAGTLTIVALFIIAHRMADAMTGLVAALFLAVAILHVRDSHFAMTDVLMTLLVTSSFALLFRALEGAARDPSSTAGTARLFALSGLVAGLATSTKYNAAVLLGAMGAAQVICLARSRNSGWSPRTWAPSAAFAIAFAVGFICATPYAVLDFPTFAADLQFDFTHLAEGHGLNLGKGWIYHVERSLPYGVGVATFAAAIVGLLPMVRHYGPHAFVFAGFAVPFYLAIGSGTTVFFRYILPLVPIVCLLAAVGVRHAGPWLASRTRFPPRAVTLLLATVVAVPGLLNCVWFDALLAKTDTRILAARWLIPRLRPNDTLHDAGGAYTKLDLRDVRFHEWPFDPDSNSFGHPEGHTPDWLVLSESPLRLYASIPPQLRQLAQEKYDLVLTLTATKGRARAAVYDLQDAFFLPFSRFDTIERPGPTVRIYRRKDAGRSALTPAGAP
jgi:4-amino-4-deoxy-L-arabinose transferase-like glycosyltransferase